MKKNKMIYIIPYNDARVNKYFNNNFTPFLCYINSKIISFLSDKKLNKTARLIFISEENIVNESSKHVRQNIGTEIIEKFDTQKDVMKFVMFIPSMYAAGIKKSIEIENFKERDVNYVINFQSFVMVDVGILGKPFILEYEFINNEEVLRFRAFKKEKEETVMKYLSKKLTRDAFPNHTFILN